VRPCGAATGQQLKNIVEMPPAAVRGQPLNGFGAEQRQPGSVVLPDHQIRQRRGQRAAILEFIGLTEVHRGARIQQDVTPEVGVALELFDVELVRAPPHFPVHVPQVVALHVLPVGGELGAVAQKRTLVKPAQETLNHVARQQRNVIKRAQQVRIQCERRGHNQQPRGQSRPARPDLLQ
jgi:hypothetical protein